MMNKYVLTLLVALLAVCSLPARKEYRQLRSYIKKGNDLGQAVKLVDKCMKDSVMSEDPELYRLAADVQRKLNDTENMKLYLKQAYDTVSFFSTTYSIFDYTMKSDEKEMLASKNGDVSRKNRIRSRSLLKTYYPNIFNAGLFYIKKKNYKEADHFFSMYISSAMSPIFRSDSVMKNDRKLPRAAFWSMMSCFEQKDYKGVFKYDSLARCDTANADLYLQYKALSYSALGQVPEMVAVLKEGLATQPSDLFFFSHLADYYNSIQNYKLGLTLVDSLLSTDTTSVMYKFAKSVILFNLKDYDNCIQLSKEVIAKDTTNSDSYYYIGSCYFNRATDIDDQIQPNVNARDFTRSKNLAKKYFEAAEPYMERYRKLRPDDSARWAAPLYRIYLALNKDKQLEEMDQILKQADEKKKEKK